MSTRVPLSPRRRFLRAASAVTVAAGLAATFAVGDVAVALPAAASTTCTPVQFVAARATLEPGTMGTLLGPLASSLEKKLPGKVSSYGVPYEAGTVDYPLSTAGGVKDVVDHLTAQGKACPNQRFVLAGYSQGAQVIGDALATSGRALFTGDEQIPADVSSRIAAVVLFGDPRFNGSEPYDVGSYNKNMNGLYAREKGGLARYASRIQDYCNGGDSVCQAGSINAAAHLSYFGTTANTATNWIAKTLTSRAATAGATTAPKPGSSPASTNDAVESGLDSYLAWFFGLFASSTS